jgi:nitrogen fixation protein NifX
MSSAIPREVALRIGLAARELPGLAVGEFVSALIEQLGAPLTLDKLAKATVTHLKNAIGEAGEAEELFGVPRLKAAVERLWGQTAGTQDLPPVEPYADGDMPDSIRVAVASDSGEELNAHFGSARRFLVYQMTPAEIRLIDIRPTDGSAEAEDGSAFRANLIRDCRVLFIQSIGGPAAAKVINAGIYPLKLDPGPARAHLAELQRKMGGAPPPWLAKAMNRPVEDRIRFRVEEAWS